MGENYAMLTTSTTTTAYSERCPECSGKVVDVDDEFVCSSCGSVTVKEIMESREDRKPQALDYTKHSLGSFLGPLDYGYEERFSRGFSSASSTFGYLKTISDHSCRDEGALYTCAKLMERVCEKLRIPRAVIGQSIRIAKSMLETRKERGRYTLAAISTFSIVTACKIYGITSVGVREVVETHRDLGYRVKASAMIRMSIDSPVKLRPRRAEDYLSRVVARLSSDEALGARIREGASSDEAAYHRMVLETARAILAMTDQVSRGGHNPCALAATGVYAAEVLSAKADRRKKVLTQRDIAQCVGVAEYTVREQYVEIFRPHMEEIQRAVRRGSLPSLGAAIRTSQRPPGQILPTP